MSYNAGSAFVSISPSFEGFHKKIAAELKSLDPQFDRAAAGWGRAAAKSFAGAFQADLRKSFLTLPQPKIRPDVDDAKAKAELDLLTRRRSATVGVNVDKGGLSGLSRLLSGVSGSGGLLGALPSGGGLTALVAAVPAAEALATEAVAAGSGLAAAGAGAGAFAALAKPAFGKVSDAYKQIGKDQKAYNDALTQTAKNRALAKLQQDWRDLDPAERGAVKGAQGLATEYGNISRAFEPQAFKVFDSGLKLAGDLLPKVTPFASTFADGLDKILGRADAAAKSKGFAQFLSQFHALEGPALGAIGDGLAKLVPAVGKLLTVFSGQDDAKAIGIAFNVITGAVDGAAYAVNRLRTNWDGMAGFAKAAVHDTESAFAGLEGFALGTFKRLADVSLGAFKAIVHGAADAFGWVPGVGGKLRQADAALGAFKNSVDGTFASAISSVNQWKTSLDNAPKVAKLKGDISDLTGKLATAEKELKNPDLTKTRRAAIQADISDLKKKISDARAQLNAINGKVARTFVTTTVQVTGGTTDFPIVKGRGFASGTSSAPAGWALVGERGPELVRFSGGETVLNHAASLAASQSMASLSALRVPSLTASPSLPGVGSPVRGGQLTLRLSYAGSGNAVVDALVEGLRADIGDKSGGDVQRHLGRP